MSLSPIAAIEKLINEHGSAAILRDRLLLASDQFNALERKNVEFTSRIGELEAEIQNLRARVTATETERDQVKESAQRHGSADRPELEQQILVSLASQPGLTIPQIARHLQVGLERARFHVDELFHAEFIYGAHFMGRESEWHLGQDGRRYLLQRNLLA